MVPEKSLYAELVRLPKLIKMRLKKGDKESVMEALEMMHEITTLEWVLSDED